MTGVLAGAALRWRGAALARRKEWIRYDMQSDVPFALDADYSDEERRWRGALAKATTVVIKIGSSVLCSEPGESRSVLHRVTLEQFADDIEKLLTQKIRIIVVSSGAIGLGLRELGLARKPGDIASRQALAAIGQSSLMRAWREALRERGAVAGQVLLTQADFTDRKRYLAARRAMTALLDFGAVPIVNENDTVANEDLQFGDNDRLSAQVAALMGAEALVLLSTHDGLFTADPAVDPSARPVRFVAKLDDTVQSMVDGTTSSLGTGGMGSKLEAARAATHFGLTTVIARGREARVLRRVLAGERLGTLFPPTPQPITSRKHWIGYVLQPLGEIVVDAGAATALTKRGRSLLPSGIVQVRGEFDLGDPVRIISAAGAELARGLAAYCAADILRIAGQRSDRIHDILGYRFGDEVIHRDDLVLL